MIIKFVTEKSNGDCDHGNERHNLSSPHDCENVIKAVIEAVKRGEEIKFQNVIGEYYYD